MAQIRFFFFLFSVTFFRSALAMSISRGKPELRFSKSQACWRLLSESGGNELSAEVWKPHQCSPDATKQALINTAAGLSSDRGAKEQEAGDGKGERLRDEES